MAASKKSGQDTPTYANDLGDRIAKVAERVGGKKKLARRLTTYESNIYRYINGETSISARMLVDIAKVGNVSVEWLATGHGDSPDATPEDPNQSGMSDSGVENYVKLPRYEIGSDDGADPLASSLQIVDFISFRRSWLAKELKVHPTSAAAIQIVDDAMAPAVAKNDLMVIDMSQNHIRTAGVYAIVQDDQIVARRAQRLFSGEWTLLCDNIAYPSETITEETLLELNILGKGVWIGKRL